MKQTIFYLQNNKLTSDNLTELEIFEMIDRKYNLSIQDIKFYLKAYDHLTNSLCCDKFKYFLFVQEKLNIQIKFPVCIGKLKLKLIKIN